MLIFNSKLDNSISGTFANVNNAIASIETCQILKTSLPNILESNIIQALIDSGSPTNQTAVSIQATISGWPIGKAPGKTTWCSKRGLLANSGLSDLALALQSRVITYQEYNLILISKIWISDEKNSPAIFTNALKVLSLVDNTTEPMANAVVTAYNKIIGGTYSKGDFHSAELTQFCSIVSAAGFDTSRTGPAIKNIIGQWGCNFGSIKKPKYGWGVFPDFRLPTDVYSYTGNMTNGIFEAEFENPSAFNSMFPNIHVNEKLKNDMIQQIYYGAPGTGKSNEISELTGKGKDGKKFEKDYTFRVTFHPDSDYSTFVGAYKPTTYKPEGSGERKITYDFRPQAFIKAYINAWLHPDKPIALVIEEINRGNCAQVFGDIFQLLDRHKEGLSKYPIEADIDMMDYIARAFRGEIAEFGTKQLSEENKASINLKYQDHYDNAFDKIKNGEILALPTNLSILATMNTSDQSLFPMDSAFKRRWKWIYVPIKNHNKDWKIEVGEIETKDEEGNIKKEIKYVDWWKFLEKINEVIFRLTDSEDKQLGYHFIHLEDGEKIIDNKTFVGKVIFYLWNDVFKDYGYGHDCCKSKDKKEKVSFAKFYKNDSTDLQVDAEVLKVFFEQLGFGTEKGMEFETTPVADNADTPPATPVPADEEGQPEGNAEAENDANETGDVPSAELSAEPAQEVNDEASNDATGEAPMNPDETVNG